MLYKKILVPIDGSEHAALACRHAVALAEVGKMEILLLHCYEELPAAIGGSARDTVIRDFEDKGNALLAPCKQCCAERNVPCKTLVISGAPGRTIVQVAANEGCDLIVMGSRGLSEFSGIVMGSVSHRVLRHATMPVLIVR